jgi:hypothetical protein
MSDIIEMPRRESAGLVANEVHQFSAIEIRQRVNLVQEIMRTLMIKDTHYGVIPGTKKPSLYKPGAEMLCVTFRIADKYEVEDLTANGMSRFRVRCIGVHQVTGVVLGEGLGACSSGEEKYKWRAAICTEEFDLTPETHRRLKFTKWNNKVEKKIQIRTEPEDQENTVLKMACKRAKIAMTLNVTGASDIFTQDIEDLPEELRQNEEQPVQVPEIDIQPMVDAAKATTTHAEALVLWRKYNAELVKHPIAHKLLKEEIVKHRATLPADPPPVVEPKPEAQPEPVDEFLDAMDKAGQS